MMRKLRCVVEVGHAIEALVERREDVDGAFALERYQERVIRVEHTSAVNHDIKDAGRKVFGFVRKEPDFAVVEPTPHPRNGGSQVRRCRLPLRGTPTEDGQSLEHEDVDKNDAVPVAFESRREINGTLVLRIVGVEQSNDDVGVENDLSHRRVRQCRLLRRPARHEPRRLQHGSCATMQRHEVFADALPARRQPPLRGVRSRRDSQGRALDRRALRVRVERPRRKDGPISASENQLRAPQDSNL